MKLTIFTLLSLVSGTVLKLDFDRTTTKQETAESCNNPLPLTIQNYGAQYNVKVQVGTPPQSLVMLLDTGSSDMFVQDDQYFNPDNSSTLTEISNGTFFIGYADGTNATGDWIADTVTIGGATIPKQQMGLAEYNSVRGGYSIILGIGLRGLETSVQNLNSTYPNVPESLFLNGDIPSYTYSLYMNSIEATSGSILFGGVDASKYSGELLTVPLVAQDRFDITLSSLNIKSLTSNKSINALEVTGRGTLDTGTTMTYLPTTTFKTIIKEWNVDFDKDYGYMIPEYCFKQLQNEFLEYNFQGAIIKVPVSQLFHPMYTGDDLNTVAEYPNGQKAYEFQVQDGNASTFGLVFGESFLRSAYVVYDLAKLEVSLGQADYSGGEEQVEEIMAGEDVPGATRVKNWGAVYSNEPITTTVSYQPTEYTLNPRPVWLN